LEIRNFDFENGRNTLGANKHAQNSYKSNIFVNFKDKLCVEYCLTRIAFDYPNEKVELFQIKLFA